MLIVTRVAAACFYLGAAAISLTADARADEKSELIEEMFRLGGYEQSAASYMAEYAKAMTESWKVTLVHPDDAALAALERELAGRLVRDYLLLKPQLAELYRNNFSEEELRELLAFFNSPIGKVFVSKSRKIDEEIAKVYYPESLKQAEKHWYDVIEMLRKQGMKL